MHFSIPDTRENKDGSGSYVTYNIYINGSYHCSLRYRQLYQFHLQLKKAFGAQSLYTFPPKKFFPLTSAQLEERRSQIEKYIQIASQDSMIANSDIFNGFLLAAQQETHECIKDREYSVSIYQLNWQCITLSAYTNENSQIVLERYAEAIQLEQQFLPYFCFYLVCHNQNDYQTIRRLQNFESPYLTLCIENRRSNDQTDHLIMIRKSYWDSEFDQDLYNSKAAVNILYLQALYEVEKGYILSNNDVRNRLTSLQAMGDKIEYLKIARTLKYYNYIHFEPCYCDHPMPKCYVRISTGNQELHMRLINSNEELTFRVIRIKCWRLTTSTTNLSIDDQANSSNEGDQSTSKGRFELSFEYLVSKGVLKWITIVSSQAVLMSTCMQSMVEEMLLKREGKKFRSQGLSMHYNTSPSYSNVINNGNEQVNGSNENCDWNYTRKDGSNMTATSFKQNEPNKLSSNENKSKSSHNKQIEINATDSAHMKVKYSPLVENNVFDEIGDDDL